MNSTFWTQNSIKPIGSIILQHHLYWNFGKIPYWYFDISYMISHCGIQFELKIHQHVESSTCFASFYFASYPITFHKSFPFNPFVWYLHQCWIMYFLVCFYMKKESFWNISFVVYFTNQYGLEFIGRALA